MDVVERIQEVISDKSMSLKDFSEALDVNYRTMQRYIAGERSVSTEFLQSITDRMDVSASWLLSGAGEKYIQERPSGRDDTDFIQIKRHPIEVSAGNGADGDADTDTGTGHYAYNKKWLERRGLKPSALSVISVRGDSMEPEINDKDLVLLDNTDTTPRDGNIYVVRFSGDVFVKRIQKLPGDQLQLVSRNEVYPPIVIQHPEADGVEIIGRVVSSMHEW